MTRRRLVIDSNDQGQFFLLVEGGTVTIGGSRKHADTVLKHLRVARIHCELEVEGDHVTLGNDELQPGKVFNAGSSHFHLEVSGGSAGLAEEASSPPGEEAAAAAESGQARLRKRLLVIDGADHGRAFALPDTGTVCLGKDRRHADLLLHDLHVARVHCQLEIDGDEVAVVHQASVGGTLINGQKITRQAMQPGDVLRIGNSHLRLEVVLAGEEFAKVAGPSEVDDDDSMVTVAEEDDDDGEAPVELERDSAGAEADEESEEEEEPLPDDAPEAVRLLHVLRDKLPQLSGHTFGHYQLGAVLGRGRFGVVFEAAHLESGQVVGMKVFSPLFPHGDQELARFARVMKGLLPLRHRYLLALTGAGKTGTYTWVAREYVKGESLAEVIRRLGKSQRPDWKLGVRTAVQVGQALEFARKNHLRHGKITPANILLQRSDKTVKLADLMLGAALEGSRLWQAGQAHRPVSDLAYLSPEQAAPKAFVDELSDIYSLGAVVYALLTGRPPFQGDTKEDLLEQIQGPSKPTRPGAFNASIPAALEKVVLKMLAKRQEDRYQTPAEMLAEIEAIAGS